MIDTRDQMGPRGERPHLHDALVNFSGFIEHFQLVVFGGQKIEIPHRGRLRPAFLDAPASERAVGQSPKGFRL